MSVFKSKAKAPMAETTALPAGNHTAVLVAMIDLGSHEEEYKGKRTTKRLLYFVWEVPAERAYFGETYSTSVPLSSKSRLREMLESWRGKKYQPDEEIDYLAILGKPCSLNIMHKPSGERSYPQLAGVAKLAKGTPAPKPTHNPVAWELDSPEPVPDFDWLPWCFCEGARMSVRDAISVCQERKSPGPAPAPSGNGAHKVDPAGSDHNLPATTEEEDTPF